MVGRKVTVIVHFALAANDEPQVEAEIAKSPLEAFDEILTADELMFVIVITRPALVVPITSLPKAKLAEEKLRTGSIVKLVDTTDPAFPALSVL
jgi:hypothetical protein